MFFRGALAPRKKLWSTPAEVIDAALDVLQITADDVAVDIGAGDGRFLIRCAERSEARQCIGVEIDEERAGQAIERIAEKGFPDSRVKMIVGNALEQSYDEGTAFFLYLVPRGLRIILPMLKAIPHRIRVITYMSPFPDTETPKSSLKVSTEQHPDAKWPLYYYEFG